MEHWSHPLPDAEATVALGRTLGALLRPPFSLHLLGDLGAGKTTFTRGLVQARGHAGPVKSPTYTLVEPYELPAGPVYHFDLYRLADAEELEFMGLRDYFAADALCIVEWPEKGAGVLPEADLVLELLYQGSGRLAQFQAKSQAAQELLAKISSIV
ncbi:MAG: tRNA (adenosine(37)-N6)-threonylcarbamoyltransferase complex ATPase subunit type 1 TsaE [Gammaproteobacteria bacterium]|nr:tRNA (adenosine(37)-N6)-threonylcarbamoyltransferase complex ATPase subunit type 1 TsaE [Gammaproteobacteria bacterium]